MARDDVKKAIFPKPVGCSSKGALTLLDRLRQWPRYESALSHRQADIDHWVQTVQQRQAEGAPRRVLFIHGQLPGETGSGVYMQQISAEAIRRGIDLYILSAGYKSLNASDIRNVPKDRIFTCHFTLPGQSPVPGAVKSPISGMSVVMPYPVMAFRDRTEEQLIDWLSVFGNHIADLVSRLQPDVIHVDHLWFLAGLSRLVAPWIPLVASCHGTAYKLILDAPRFRELVVPCVSSADHVCAISPETVRECIETFEVPGERISIEGYGFEPELFHFKPVDRSSVLDQAFGVALPPNELLAVAVGKFADWKGFKEFALAIGLLRKQGNAITGIIVGEGDPRSRADLENHISQNGLRDHLLLPGKVQRIILPDIYRSADLYVLPSHVEPYGMVLMEAMACGAPSVFGQTGGPPSFVPAVLVDNGLAVMVPPIRLTAENEALPGAREIYARNLAQGMMAVIRKHITPEERQYIAQSMLPLSWGRLVDNLVNIYNRVVFSAIEKLP